MPLALIPIYSDSEKDLVNKNSYFTVRDLPKPERPRERLQKFGAEALSAKNFCSRYWACIPKKSVMNIAQEILARFGNIRAISQATIEELSQIKGLALPRQHRLKQVLSLGKDRS